MVFFLISPFGLDVFVPELFPARPESFVVARLVALLLIRLPFGFDAIGRANAGGDTSITAQVTGALIVLLRAAGEQEENGPSSVPRATGPKELTQILRSAGEHVPRRWVLGEPKPAGWPRFLVGE